MKFAASVALFVVTISPAHAFTKVNIDINCKGVNVNKFSLSEKTLAAHALESSYQ